MRAINITDNTIHDFNGAGVVVMGFAAGSTPSSRGTSGASSTAP